MKWRNFLVIRNPLTSAVITLIAVVMALAAWMAIHAAVSRDQKAWILGQRLRIENALTSRFNLFSNALIQTRALLSTDDKIDIPRIRHYIQHLDLNHRFPGLLGLGVAQVVTAKNLNLHEIELRKIYPRYNVHPRIAKSEYIPVVVVGPESPMNRPVLGFDLSSEATRSRGLQETSALDKPVLSGPVRLDQDAHRDKATGFLLTLPVYAPTAGSQPTIAYVYAAIRARDFINGVFGPPDPKNERVNFELSYENGSTFYSRFADGASKGQLTSQVAFTGPLSGWKLKVSSLPMAFPSYDTYFPDLVGLLFLFGAGLIIYSIQRTSRQFALEDQYKHRLIKSERHIRAYSEKLLRLNRASKSISSEINLDELFKKIALVTADVVQMPSVAIFAGGSNPQRDAAFSLRFHQGINGNIFQSKSIGSEEFSTWRSAHRQGVIRSNSMGATLVAKRLFVSPPPSWIVLPIVKRTEEPLGFIAAYAPTPVPLDEHTLSILDALSSQIATALENSYLFARAEEASRLKTAFLANMSHEIRTPLGAVIGYSDILTHEAISPADRLKINEHMRRNVDQVTRIIDDILDISKIEANKLDIVPAWMDVPMFLRDLQSVLQMKGAEKNLSTKISLSTPVPRKIFCDEVRCKQILMNLIGNSLKFTEEGSIEVIVEHDQGLSKLRVLVKDTGRGIPKSAQGALFEPFSQVDDSKTRRFGGTGLGLALSRRLARLMGGDIRLLSSDSGQGAVFEASIRAPHSDEAGWMYQLEEEKGAGAATPQLVGKLANCKILLVEDSEDNQDIFRFFLESAQARVTVTGTGLEALKMTEKNIYDLILMDIQLPELDGKETTKILRQRGWSGPIVALTAHGFAEERQSVLEAGCDGQITKPVTGEQLVFQVSEFLQQRIRGGTNANSYGQPNQVSHPPT